MKVPRVAPKPFAIFVVACAALGGLLSWVSGMPYWAAALIVALALMVNGLIAEVEDRSPGGFFNPRD